MAATCTSTTTRPATSTRSPSSRAATPSRLAEYEAWLHGVADVLAPLLLRTPPRIGSRRPRDLLDQLRTAWGLRGLDVRGTAEATRLFTMSIRDLLDEWFESPELKGVLAINGVIGTWAGPDEPGTAYVMMHHTIGDVGDGQLGSWGYPIGGMGAVSDAIRRSAESFGATVLTDSPVASIDVLERQGARRDDGRRSHVPRPRSSSPPRIRRSRSSARSTGPSSPTTSSATSNAGARAPAPSRSTSPCPRSRTSPPGRATSRTRSTPVRSSCATRSTTSSAPSRTPARVAPRHARSPTASSRRHSTGRCAPTART